MIETLDWVIRTSLAFFSCLFFNCSIDGSEIDGVTAFFGSLTLGLAAAWACLAAFLAASFYRLSSRVMHSALNEMLISANLDMSAVK